MIIEACVNSAISAVEAFHGGAHRVELCENMYDGGTTPSAGSILFAREHLPSGLFVMIRPRGGDFLYSDNEFAIMKDDVAMAKKLGANGVVFGILLPDGTIDMERMRILAELARPMGITCHRAFDMTADPFQSMENLITLGVDRILTSGQQPTAPLGANLIRDLIKRAAGRIVIMPGCGVKEHNVEELVKFTDATEVHIHLEKQQAGSMQYQQRSVHMGAAGKHEYEHTITDRERISTVVRMFL